MVPPTAEDVRRWLVDRLAEEPGADLKRIRTLAHDGASELGVDAEGWARALALVIPEGHRELILAAALGLGREARRLGDLFGERMGGWARIVEGEELTDTLARPLGWWVIGDLSRIGYLEAWAKRGETVWKRRLALIAAEVVNLENEPRAHETLRIVRHVMESDERLLRDAAVRAVVSLGDTEETERFLAWWAPRLEKSEFDRFSEGLGEERMQRIRELA